MNLYIISKFFNVTKNNIHNFDFVYYPFIYFFGHIRCHVIMFLGYLRVCNGDTCLFIIWDEIRTLGETMELLKKSLGNTELKYCFLILN